MKNHVQLQIATVLALLAHAENVNTVVAELCRLTLLGVLPLSEELIQALKDAAPKGEGS